MRARNARKSPASMAFLLQRPYKLGSGSVNLHLIRRRGRAVRAGMFVEEWLGGPRGAYELSRTGTSAGVMRSGVS
jgi:hypothetical protein